MSFLLALIACKKEDEGINVLENQPSISAFSINGIDFTIEDGLILGHNVNDIDRSSLVATFTAEGTVSVSGQEQISGVTTNNFTSPVRYIVSNSTGTEEYTVKYSTFTGLARLYINTEDGTPITREDYVSASFKLDPNFQFDGDVLETTGSIRGRGNSTWGMAKKPYRIKFDSKTSLFNMAEHKSWVLLANYADKTLMRNYLAYRLGDKIEMPFAPSYHFVEVFLNGQHQGNYMLSDQVQVASTRVNVPELDPSDNGDDVITGGYLLEIDKRILDAKDEPYFESNKYPIVIKSPDEPSAQQLEYISNYVKEAEDAIFGQDFTDPINGFRKYFDETAMIRWFIVSEVFKNVDSRDFSSIYFYKNRGGKLTMGPVWDFDLGAGNAGHCAECMQATGWHVKHHHWFERMYEDPAFKAKVKSMWQQYKSEIDDLLPTIDKVAAELAISQEKNFKLWPNFNDPNWATVQGKLSYKSQVDYLRDFLAARIAWMDGEINR